MTVYHVSSESQLVKALKSAGGGDVLKLDGGNYGHLSLDGGDLKAGVTITSANGNAAKFTSLTVNGAKNLVLDGLTFGGSGGGNGLKVSGGTGIVVKNSDFSQLTNGAAFSKVTDLVVENNFFTSLKHDAMRFADVSNVVIKGNKYIEKGSAKGFTHKDFIQFWTNSENDEGSSSNVKIVGNEFSSADGLTHGILVLNESNYGFHKNFVIENNDFYSSHVHAISLMDVAGLAIRDNTLIHNKEGGNDNSVPLINVAPNAQSVTITGNVAPSIPDQGNSSWSVWGNTETGGKGLKHWLGGAKGTPIDKGPKGADKDDDGGPKVGPKNGTKKGDTLEATAKAEVLIGGEGADRFDFDSVADSRPGARDVIRAGGGAKAFEGVGKPGGDRIDLEDIDANPGSPGDQDFIFGKLGKGGIALVNRGGDTLVCANLDADKGFEFALLIDDGGIRAGDYGKGDFIL